MIELGQDNTRMKDFYDLWQMSRTFEFDGDTLCKAIRATFSRRTTQLKKELPTALTDGFAANSVKITQWRAFLRKSRLQDAEGGWPEVILTIRVWLQPVIAALQQNATLSKRWHPGDGWV